MSVPVIWVKDLKWRWGVRDLAEPHRWSGRAGSLCSLDSQMLFVLHLEESDLKHRCLVGGMKHMLQCQKITGNQSRKQDICSCYNMTKSTALVAWDWIFRGGNGEQFNLGANTLGTLDLVLGYSSPGLWKPAGRGSKQSTEMIKGLRASMNKGRLELNMYSSVK